MRYCGIDVSAKPANQQLCTLHERRGPDGWSWSPPSTSRARSSRSRAPSRASARARPSWPSTRRPATGWTCWPGVGVAASELGLPGRPLRAHAGLRRAALPPRAAAVPGAVGRRAAAGVAGLDARRLRAVRRARPGSALPAAADAGASRAAWATSALASGRLCETYPDAIFCALLGHRPGAKRTPSGLQERIAVLKLKGDRRRRRRPVAAHAGRARRLCGRLRRLRPRRGLGCGSATPARAWSCCRRWSSATATPSCRRPGARQALSVAFPGMGRAKIAAPTLFAALLAARARVRGGARLPRTRARPRAWPSTPTGTAHVAWLTRGRRRRHARVLPGAARQARLRDAAQLALPRTASARSRCCCRGRAGPDRRAAAASPPRSLSSFDGGDTFAVATIGGPPAIEQAIYGPGDAHLAHVRLRPGAFGRFNPDGSGPADLPVQFGSATESLETSLAPWGAGFVAFFSGQRARSVLWNGLGDPNLHESWVEGPRLGAARRPDARSAAARHLGRLRAPRGVTQTYVRRLRSSGRARQARRRRPRRPLRPRLRPGPARRHGARLRAPRGRGEDRALAQRAPLDAAAAAVPRQRAAGPAGRARPARRLDGLGRRTRATRACIRSASPRSRAPRALTARLHWDGGMQRSRNGRMTQTPPTGQPRAAPSSAPTASRRCPTATTSPSSTSSCAPRAWRSSASWCSTASSRTRTTTSARARSRSSRR